MIEFNSPSFQAEKDGNLWEAISYFATVDANGVITITGSDNFETVTLTAFPNDSFTCQNNENSVFNSEPGLCYDVLTTENNSFATLTDIDGTKNMKEITNTLLMMFKFYLNNSISAL